MISWAARRCARFRTPSLLQPLADLASSASTGLASASPTSALPEAAPMLGGTRSLFFRGGSGGSVAAGPQHCAASHHAAPVPTPLFAPLPARPPASVRRYSAGRRAQQAGSSGSGPPALTLAAAASGGDGGAGSSGAARAAARRGASRLATDLQGIKGVGPTYEGLLVQRGVTSVQQLQEKMHVDFQGDPARLQKFLQEVVGIRNSQHCAWVAAHVEALDWAPSARPRVTLAVEGNIGAGKSTFLRMLENLGRMELQDVVDVQVVPEPVDDWQSAPGRDPQGVLKRFNLLEKFYSDPQRYAFTFQNYVLMSRMARDRETRGSSAAPLRVLERSIFSDRMVFVRAMHEAGRMEDWELTVYDSWFNMAMASDEHVAPNGFVYLRASPDTCIQRMKKRARSEEAGVEPAYLEQLHQHHEDWLQEAGLYGPSLASLLGAGGLGRAGAGGYHAVDWRQAAEGEEGLYRATTELRLAEPTLDQRRDSAVLSATGDSGGLRLYHPGDPQSRHLPEDLRRLLGPEAQPESIRDKVLFLHRRGSEVLQPLGNVLNGTPALILDHDHDSLADLDHQKWQAKQVADFFSYVQQLSQYREVLQPERLALGGSSGGGVPVGAGAAATAGPGEGGLLPTQATLALRARFEALKRKLLSSTEASIDAQNRVLRDMEAMLDRAAMTGTAF